MERSRIHSKTIKSLVQLILISLVLYGITHNKYARPVSTVTKGVWTIEKAVYPLLGGLAGHNYIVLRDNEGNIQREFHGLPTNPKTGKYKTISFSKGDILKAYEFPYPLLTRKNDSLSSEVVLSGNGEAIRKTWKQGEACISTINTKAVLYPQFGVSFINETVNSNSVADTLLTCMDLPTPHVGLLTPGTDHVLLQK